MGADPKPQEGSAEPPLVLDVHKAALQEIDRIVGNETILDADGTTRVRGVLFAALSEEHPQPEGELTMDLHVNEHAAPPDWVAYAEDARDRLWTGKGAGTWECICHDPQGITGGRQSWAQAWRDHGPLVPLIPADTARQALGRTEENR